MKARFASHMRKDGVRPVLAFTGRKKVHTIVITPALRVESFPLTENRWIREYDHKRPMEEIVGRYLEVGMRAGCTEGARRLLRHAVQA